MSTSPLYFRAPGNVLGLQDNGGSSLGRGWEEPGKQALGADASFLRRLQLLLTVERVVKSPALLGDLELPGEGAEMQGLKAAHASPHAM